MNQRDWSDFIKRCVAIFKMSCKYLIIPLVLISYFSSSYLVFSTKQVIRPMLQVLEPYSVIHNVINIYYWE